MAKLHLHGPAPLYLQQYPKCYPGQLDLTSLTLDTYTASASATYTLSFFRISTFALPTDSKLLITFNPAYVGLITPLCSSVLAI